MPRLPPEWIAHLADGVSHRLGACAADGTPQLARALAADVEPDGRLVVLLSRSAAGPALEAVEQTGHVALVMACPSTHRVLHVKGADAVVGPARDGDQALLHARGEAFIAQVLRFGFPADSVRRFWYELPPGDLVRIVFTVGGAWNQTPGPGAGQPVELLA